MLVSWNWLQDWVDLSGLTPDEVAVSLTLAGLEVEGVHRLDEGLDRVVVARIEAREQHPNADRLSVCNVFDGEKTLQIVCGATNMKVGDCVPLAQIGAKLPNGLKIKKGKLRGEVSEGMLCAAEELGLDEPSDGLLILPTESEPGREIAAVLGLNDTIIDVALTPNRSDCLSICGIAREVAVLLGRELRPAPQVPLDLAVAVNDEKAADHLSVSIAQPERCGRYAAALVTDVKVAPSPLWLQQRLRAVGQRPINNVVDITNYINLEYGQPLHAFDRSKLSGETIMVRTAKQGEALTTLDDVERELHDDDLVIADESGAIALAGVMGGASTEVSDETTTLIIECANFSGTGVRRSAQRHHLHSESSHRFERGVDGAAVPEILERTLQLLQATMPEGTTLRRHAGIVDECPGSFAPATIVFDTTLLVRVIGVTYTDEEVASALEGLGVEISAREGSSWTLQIPTRRPDLTRPIDIVEEVGRVVGYDRLPAILPEGSPGQSLRRRSDAPVSQEAQPVVSAERLDGETALRDALFSLGYFEAVNWAITAPETLAAVTGSPAAVELSNPLSADLSVMRTTLLGGLLRNVGWNLARRASRVALFEVGSRFAPDVREGETSCLSMVLCGLFNENWHDPQREVDVHDLSGALEVVSAALKRPLRRVAALEPPAWAHPGAVAQIFGANEALGFIGEVHPEVLEAFDIDARVFALELNLDALFDVPSSVVERVGVPRMPASRRDVALLVDAKLPWSAVEEALAGFEEALLEKVSLFDVYRGEGVADDQKSLALTASYRHPTESLTDEQVENAHARLVTHLESALNATKR